MKGKMYNASLLVLNQHWATNFPNNIIFRYKVKYFQSLFFFSSAIMICSVMTISGTFNDCRVIQIYS